MHLSKFTDFGFRVLIELALNPGKISVRELSDKLDLSKNHLSKVVHRLNQLGYIEGIRGRDGGIALKVKPQDILLSDLVTGLESHFELVECMNCKSICNLETKCQIRESLGNALLAFFGVLAQSTLADICHQQSELRA
jgi:Rrf2 family nitric oxide-sensitive transcriptional repressor